MLGCEMSDGTSNAEIGGKEHPWDPWDTQGPWDICMRHQIAILREILTVIEPFPRRLLQDVLYPQRKFEEGLGTFKSAGMLQSGITASNA